MESACAEIIRLAEKVMDGGEITQEEAKSLIRTKDEDTMLLLAMADKIRQKFNGNAVDFCAIINARSGHCPVSSALSPSYQSTHSTFLPPSFGRRCPEGAEVGSRSGIFTHGDTNPASLRSSAPSRGRGENDS